MSNNDEDRLTKGVTVNPDDLRTMKKEMLSCVSKIAESCKECYRMIDDSKKVYDTPTSQYFRDKSSEYVFKNQKYIDEIIIPYINELDNISKMYDSAIMDIKAMVGNEAK